MTTALIERPAASAPAAPHHARAARPVGIDPPRLVPVPSCEPPLDARGITNPVYGPSAQAQSANSSAATFEQVGQPGAFAADALAAQEAATTPLRARPPASCGALAAAPTAHRRWAPVESLVSTPMSAPPSTRRPSAPSSSARPQQRQPPRPQSRTPTTVRATQVPSWSCDDDMGVAATTTAALPPALDSGSMLTRALLEALAGHRDLAQLRRHCAPEVLAGLEDIPVLGRGKPVQLVSIWVCQPRDGVAEVSTVFQCCGRVRAMALQMQGVDGRWRITAMQLG